MILISTGCNSKSNQNKNLPETTVSSESEQITADEPQTKTGVKLVESITDENATIQFEYDDQYRVVKTTYYYEDSKTPGTILTFTYNSAGGIDVKALVGNPFIPSYVNHGQLITQQTEYATYLYTINSDGNIIKSETQYEPGVTNEEQYVFEYINGNKIREWMDGGEIEYKHDNNPTPFANCESPRWFLWGKGNRNNIIESIPAPEGDPQRYIFQYDYDGFPISMTTTHGSGDTSTVIYKYFYK